MGSERKSSTNTDLPGPDAGAMYSYPELFLHTMALSGISVVSHLLIWRDLEYTNLLPSFPVWMEASNLSGASGVCVCKVGTIVGGVTGAALAVDTDPGVEGNGDVSVLPSIESLIGVCGDGNPSSYWRAVKRQKLGDTD